MAGDFNAWSQAWDSRQTNVKGRALEEWAAALDLQLLNRGRTSTCVRAQGESIVDLSWAIPAAACLVREWKVLTDLEQLSDHRYISMKIGSPVPTTGGGCRSKKRSRWALKKMDEDRFMAIVLTADWSRNCAMQEEDPQEGTSWLRETVTRACDSSMPHVRQSPRRSTYWWNDEIAELRRAAIRLSRRVARSKADVARRAAASEEYRAAKKSLSVAIKRAKAGAWMELLQTLQKNPWGRPYKLVLNKLRPRTPPLTEVLEPEFTRRIINTLFPKWNGQILPLDPPGESPDWMEELEIQKEELSRAIKKGFGGKNTAPGPDGLQKKALALASNVLVRHMRGLFSECLKLGIFPKIWKRASLVLLRKEGKDPNSPSAYRPICLLDEAGKLLERVIANRLVHHLSHTGPDVSETQFGFRKGLSTLDAIEHVRTLSEEITSRGEVALAISLDVSNAFNSLP